MGKISWKCFLTGLAMMVLFQQNAFCQVKNDTTYFERFPQKVTGRFYFSRKYTAVDFKDHLPESPVTYSYRPNTTLNMGVGVSYNVLTLNLAYGFGFLNPDNGQGDTKYLDAQVHAYPDKWAIDGFLQLYKGYHMVPEGDSAPPGENFYYRSDMRVQEFGLSMKRVFNAGRFSYKAAFLQTEWQKKSAGTLLAGFEVYGGRIFADSLLIPGEAQMDPSRNFDELIFTEVGPNIGYAYTLVIDQHYFLMGSAEGNLGIGFTNQYAEEKSTNWSVNANYFLKASAGYNSEKWAVNVNYVHGKVRLAQNNDLNTNLLNGNYRLNLIYRFMPGPKVRKVLDVVNPYRYF